MTWGNVALTLAVTWAAAVTVLLWVMVGGMREWKRVHQVDHGARLADEEFVQELGSSLRLVNQDVDRMNDELVYTTAGMNACARSLAKLDPARIEHVERALSEQISKHGHSPDPEVQRLRGEVDKLSERVRMAEDLDATLSQQISAVAASIPHVPEPVDVVGVLQAALAPWTRKDPPADQPSAQRADPDDTAAPDPSLIFDPTYDEYPEPVQVVDHVGLPVIPGLPIDIPVANWGLPG